MTVEPEAADDDFRVEPSRGLGRPSWAMAISLALLAASAWLWLTVGERPSPPVVGSRFPPTRLDRFENADPFWVFGLEGRVTWLVFLPVDAAEGLKPLAQLEPFWRELRPNRRFSLVAAVVDPRRPGRSAAAVAESHDEDGLPLYVAGGEVQRLFGVERVDAPRHVLIGPRGRIDLIADGSDQETMARVARRARVWLGALAPPRDPRFLLVRAEPASGPPG